MKEEYVYGKCDQILQFLETFGLLFILTSGHTMYVLENEKVGERD